MYTQARTAYESATLDERRTLSLNIDYDTTDYEHNVILDDRVAFGSITARDGEILYGPLNALESPAFNGLIGMIYEDAADQTNRYVASNYQDVLLPENNYSVLTGIKRANPQVEMTISYPLQEEMYQYLTEHGVKGSITAYDYLSGDLLCMVSTPGDLWANADTAQESSYINKCLYNTTPGSTMKLVTLYLAECQGIDVTQLNFTCEGQYTLKADSGVITCTGNHGQIDGVTALGQSCNCWFAQLVEILDLEQAKETLAEMGFLVNESGTTLLGQVPRSCTSLTLDDVANFSTVWNLMGQDSALVSPLDMVTLAAMYATGGTAVQPRLLTTDSAVNCGYGLAHPEVFTQLHQIWMAAFAENYELSNYSQVISATKTGTCDKLGSEENRTQKLLCGYSEELHVAFYIVLENYQDGGSILDIRTLEVANRLMSEIQALNLTAPSGDG